MAPAGGLGAAALATAADGAAAGDQFEFTLKTPVTLVRRMSAMLPLTDGTIAASKLLIFVGANATARKAIHPNLGAELTNTTGIKLPAGPITVYDGGTYAGDALIEFLNDGEKRYISWGEDLSVTGTVTAASERTMSAVTVSAGVMTINRKQGYEKKYSFTNASAERKTLVIEHPITAGATLAEPAVPTAQTGTVYWFNRDLPAGGGLEFTVREEIPLYENISLSQLRLETFISYASNQEIPAAVRTSLQRAVELKQRADAEVKALAELESRRVFLISEQDRIRRNLEAAGNGTAQGQEYLRRMVALDGDIEKANADIEGKNREVKDAQAAYEAYLGSIRY
jgi:hypothetical protein